LQDYNNSEQKEVFLVGCHDLFLILWNSIDFKWIGPQCSKA
jgi:hypothetical protein